MISEELAGFIESGVSILVGTRDPRLVGEACRGLGARVDEGRTEVTLLLPDATNATTLANLRDNGRLAVCFSRAFDHHSIQLKGHVVAISAAEESDRATVDRYRSAVAEAWAVLGLPRGITMRMAHWPCTAVRVQVESIFLQTPGPGAGDRFAAGEARP